MKHKRADFGDILASLDRQLVDELASSARHKGVKPETMPDREASRGKGAVRRVLKNISFPWPSGVSGFLAGFSRHARTLYTEEADQAKAKPSISQASNVNGRACHEPQRAEEAVAKELGLGPELGMVDLSRIRREFAKKNHPDRFEPARRSAAERRMSIANMLIDEQIRQNRELRR